jgi:hypothetical protein
MGGSILFCGGSGQLAVNQFSFLHGCHHYTRPLAKLAGFLGNLFIIVDRQLENLALLALPGVQVVIIKRFRN